VLQQVVNAEVRKEKWDGRASERVFVSWDKVLLRIPGINCKLVDTWEGPFKVSEQLGPVTYLVDTGRRK